LNTPAHAISASVVVAQPGSGGKGVATPGVLSVWVTQDCAKTQSLGEGDFALPAFSE
jgi:hypothetical protein